MSRNRRNTAPDPAWHDVPGERRARAGGGAGQPPHGAGSADTGLRAHHRRKHAHLGDQAGQGDKSLDWNHVYAFTGCTTEELAAAGVRPGTRVCVDGGKRILFEVGTFLGCFFMDDLVINGSY